jgi:hypothetical protein
VNLKARIDKLADAFAVDKVALPMNIDCDVDGHITSTIPHLPQWHGKHWTELADVSPQLERRKFLGMTTLGESGQLLCIPGRDDRVEELTDEELLAVAGGRDVTNLSDEALLAIATSGTAPLPVATTPAPVPSLETFPVRPASHRPMPEPLFPPRTT